MPDRWLLDLDSETSWGRVKAIVFKGGERYYMMVRAGDVALIPAIVAEEYQKLRGYIPSGEGER